MLKVLHWKQICPICFVHVILFSWAKGQPEVELSFQSEDVFCCPAVSGELVPSLWSQDSKQSGFC